MFMQRILSTNFRFNRKYFNGVRNAFYWNAIKKDHPPKKCLKTSTYWKLSSRKKNPPNIFCNLNVSFYRNRYIVFYYESTIKS